MNLEKLKDTARKLEQKEDWRKAIDVYLKAIQQAESGAEPSPDLCCTIGSETSTSKSMTPPRRSAPTSARWISMRTRDSSTTLLPCAVKSYGSIPGAPRLI